MARRFGALIAACVALMALSCGFLGPRPQPTVVVNLVLPTATVSSPATSTPEPTATRPAATPTVRVTPTRTPQVVSRTATATKPPSPVSGAVGDFKLTAFSKDTTEDADPIDPLCQFPSGTERVYATYRWSGMPPGATYERQWYLDGELNTSGQSTWDSASGRDYASLSGTPTLFEGLWELRVLTGGKVVSRGYFISGDVGPTFGPITIAAGVDEDFDLPVGSTTVFKEGVKGVYGVFSYAGIPNGAKWSRTWFRDGQEELSKEAVWDDTSCAGTNWVGIRDDTTGLDAGEWELVVYLDGEEVQWANFTVEPNLPVG